MRWAAVGLLALTLTGCQGGCGVKVQINNKNSQPEPPTPCCGEKSAVTGQEFQRCGCPNCNGQCFGGVCGCDPQQCMEATGCRFNCPGK